MQTAFQDSEWMDDHNPVDLYVQYRTDQWSSMIAMSVLRQLLGLKEETILPEIFADENSWENNDNPQSTLEGDETRGTDNELENDESLVGSTESESVLSDMKLESSVVEEDNVSATSSNGERSRCKASNWNRLLKRMNCKPVWR